jgi:transposase
MDEPSCPGCRALAQEVADLRRQVIDLTRRLEAALRSGQRQAAPFRKGPPKAEPKPPGRKSGAEHGRHAHREPPPPETIDEPIDVPLPESCPDCHGPVDETHVAAQYQTEVPQRPIRRRFDIHVGRCRSCRRAVRGRHPLQTSDATGAAASQLGPVAQAAAVLLNKQLGLSHGKVTHVFDALFGIDLSRASSGRIGQRVAERVAPAYATILDDVRASERVSVDETGWRIGGHPAWLHAWVGERATAYVVDPRRSAAVLERLLGPDWEGLLSHDGFASYDRFTEATHQQCLAHVLRRAREMLAAATRGAVRFPRQIIGLFTEAIHLRNDFRRGRVSHAAVADRRNEFDDRLLSLVARPHAHPDNDRLARHLEVHFDEWFTFISDPTIEPTNWRAEQAIRPAVVNRKVWGGNRTPAGAHAQGVLTSVIETCRRQATSAVDFLSTTLRAFGNRLLQPPQLLPGR